MSSRTNALSEFIASAPPGELSNVIAAIKTLSDDSNITTTLEPALRKYNEEQFTAVKLPGASSQLVVVTPYNRSNDGRYFDGDAGVSWDYDHVNLKASDVRSHAEEGELKDTVKSIHRSLSKHVNEHYPSASLGVYPSTSGSIHLLTVSSKYSPSNFYNGRFRSDYTYTSSSQLLTGTITVDVHYYEDGNVRLLTKKSVKETVKGDVVSTIAGVERRYQEELNRGFAGLSEGAFRGLRRQLPVTRVKVDWEKIGAMKLGQDIAGPRR